MATDSTATTLGRLHRHATEAILDALAASPTLYDRYVMKGGLALHYGYGSPRVSHDVDLNAVDSVERRITPETTARLHGFRRLLNDALLAVKDSYDFDHLEVLPGRLSEEMPTLLTEVRYVHDGSHEGAVELQLTLSDPVCSTARRTLRGIPLHLAALEDVLAEKLKALLQQAARDKVRSNDVFDVWYFVSVSPFDVDPAVVTEYFRHKCMNSVQSAAPTKSQFRRKSVVAYSASAYDQTVELLPEALEMPTFREAYSVILDFVDRMNLPR